MVVLLFLSLFMKKFFIVFLVLLYPHISFADVYISSLLPNTGNGNE